MSSAVSSTEPGHLFVTRSDLSDLACDARLLPTDEHFNITPVWRPRLTGLPTRPDIDPPEAWGSHGVRTMLLPSEVAPGDRPQIWLTNVGADRSKPVEWFVDGAVLFVQAAAQALRDRGSPANRRERHLVALPVIGTGQGGAGHAYGELLTHLLDALASAAISEEIDVVLVTHNAEAFAAAQQVRRKWARSRWPLDDKLIGQAAELGDRARAGDLVLFLGAGVSIGAGLPTWDELLATLADRAGMTDDEQGALAKLSPVDQGRLVAGRFESQGNDLGTVIAELMKGDDFSLTHTLLANLPVGEFATMNYDDRFERAARAADDPVRVLPYGPRSDGRRWLLKMHGSIDHPDDIVLTREDYLRYADRRAALAGIVQALLITRHMLFVGFSLVDDNFHRIVDDVRKVVRLPCESDTDRFGTSVVLQRDALLEELWRDDLAWVHLGERDDQLAAAARRLEIFLDLVLLEATDNSDHLLDPRFDAVLDGDERDLRDHLKTLADEAERHPDSRAWHGMRRLLRQHGWQR